MMLSLLSSLALAAAASSTTASAEVRFASAHGINAQYSSSVEDNGVVRLHGVDRETGRPFRFTILPNGRVRGIVDGQRLRFTVGDALKESAAGQ